MSLILLLNTGIVLHLVAAFQQTFILKCTNEHAIFGTLHKTCTHIFYFILRHIVSQQQ